jgi:hypothetical protein
MQQAGIRSAQAAALALCLAFACPGASAQDDRDADTRAPRLEALSPELKQEINQLAQGLTRIQQDDVPLACGKAVENARWGVETMLEVGERNMQGGYLARADYEATAKPLNALLAQLTLSDCEAATGTRRDFYQCMSSDYNHVYACGKAHPFEH